MKFEKPNKRRAFTLVEMLVVVVIIAILMTLVSAAVFRALETARESAIFFEANGMHAGLQTNYSNGYPPADLRLIPVSGYDPTTSALYRFVQKRFPRYPISEARLRQDLLDEGIDLDSDNDGVDDFYDPGVSLVFWLVGFHKDPADPFRDHKKRMIGDWDDTNTNGTWDAGELRTSDPDLADAYYAFDVDRLIKGRYFPDIGNLYDDDNDNGQWEGDEAMTDEKLAFLYIDASGYRGLAAATVLTFNGFKPYRKNTSDAGPHYNDDSFQIVNCGRDKKLGTGGKPPSDGQPFTGNDSDNITNFSGGSTMGEFTEK